MKLFIKNTVIVVDNPYHKDDKNTVIVVANP